ncbi:glycosyltransferase [Mixta intestinalis]|uniref:N-acetylglucosaminyl-diphospho-decaprenol L-rhamnosyltransferase n=1 Tax=Mixta intestinalis TaxID=1615494 RepID=A0A6P1Q0T6_9GAMM|nr:glycosyltransferase [Mixta intestinalis]QHM71455.1 N-acetylglucosaminyl-diphospho-decaprenol L-rhamnosyltransferase [Mixta intestinalis]
MKKILISADAMDSFNEQSTYIVRAIETLIAAGYHIELATWRCGHSVQQALTDYRQTGQLQLTLGEGEAQETAYYAVLVFKGYLSAALIAQLEKNTLQTRFIFHHLSYSRLQETELDTALENQLASQVFTWTPSVAESLIAEGLDPSLLQTLSFSFPNAPQPQAVALYDAVELGLDDLRQNDEAQVTLNAEVNEALSRLLAALAEPPRLIAPLSADALRQLSLHGKICIGNLEDDYNVGKWLQQRSPSVTRENILKSFLAAADGNRIGVLILDGDNDRVALERSLDSLAQQRLTPQVICIADPDGRWQNDALVAQINLLPHDNRTCLNLLAQSGALEWLIVMPAGWQLLPHALLTFAEYHLRAPQARALYCDEIYYQSKEQQQIVLRPGCNLDLLRSFPYAGAVLSLDMRAALAVGGSESDLAPLPHYDLAWKFIEREGMQAFAAIPEVLVEAPLAFNHWKRQPALLAAAQHNLTRHYQRFGLAATVVSDEAQGICRTRYPLDESAVVTVIIPSKDNAALLKNAIESLAAHTHWQQLEIIVVDNGSTEEEAVSYLAQLRTLEPGTLRVIDYPAAFNYAAMINLAATQARGSYLLLLDNDCEVQDPAWLATLMGIAQRPEVGAVGPKLCFRDGRIQHGGYLTGIQRGVVNPFEFSAAGDAGYLHYLRATHNVSAVSGSCLLTRTALFHEAGGLDEEAFALFYADVDYCLKLKANGYVISWTPECSVLHMGGATLLLTQEKAATALAKEEAQQRLIAKWRHALTQDSRYHPQMAKYGEPFTVSERMARLFPALPGHPLPRFMASHANWYGCGNHRVIQPWKALEENVLTEGGLYSGAPKVLEVAEMQPDTILLQLPSGVGFPDLMRQYRQQCDARIIVEYDDFLPNLPIKSALKHRFPQHIVKALRRVMAQADRVVVSTFPLAEAYADFHHDIRVAQNRLAVDQWGALMSQRRTGKKIRVGWAGGGSHTGDLEIIRPVIQALQDEVEWVFMGMKPEGVRCEFHTGVPFDLYPEKLASLNLDLALVPLEMNHFNVCKSNLRLLEIGACGVPIIATRIEPYQCGLPVTLVDNRFKAWISAIRMHLADMEMTAKMGDALRVAVHQHWMLRAEGLDEWRHAWLDD